MCIQQNCLEVEVVIIIFPDGTISVYCEREADCKVSFGL